MLYQTPATEYLTNTPLRLFQCYAAQTLDVETISVILSRYLFHEYNTTYIVSIDPLTQ
jgi:hypothetical protein